MAPEAEGPALMGPGLKQFEKGWPGAPHVLKKIQHVHQNARSKHVLHVLLSSVVQTSAGLHTKLHNVNFLRNQYVGGEIPTNIGQLGDQEMSI